MADGDGQVSLIDRPPLEWGAVVVTLLVGSAVCVVLILWLWACGRLLGVW